MEDKQRKQNSFDDSQTASLEGTATGRFFTAEQLQRDVDYFRAQKIAVSLLEAGLLNTAQFARLTERNRKTFSPFLAEILPKSVDNAALQS